MVDIKLRFQEPYHMLQVIIDNIPQMIFWKNDDLVYFDCNNSYARWAGLTSTKQITGKTDHDLPWSDDELSYLEELDYRALTSQKTCTGLLQRLTNTETPKWLLNTRIPLFDRAGDFTGLLGIIEDITDQKMIENALRESQEVLQLVMDNIPHAIFWKNREYIIMGGNRNFFLDAGDGTPESVIGKTDYELTYRIEEADFFREVDRRVMDNDQPEYHIIEPQLQSDGKQAWLETNKIPLHDADGKVVGILGTYEDITERKEAEEALRRNLELMVEERTKELLASNERLKREIESRERIEEALRLSEQRYALATNAGKVCVWDWHIDTNKVYLAPGLNDLLGLDDDETPQTFDEWLLLFHEKDRDSMKNALQEHLEGATSHYENKLRMIHHDGSIHWMLLRGTIIRDKDNTRIMGSITDITDLTSAQDAEHEQRVLAEALCDTADLLNSTLNIEEVLDRILQVIGRVVPHKTANIMLMDNQLARVVRCHSIDDNKTMHLLQSQRFSVGEIDHLNHMRFSRSPMFIGDIQNNESYWVNLSGVDWVRSYIGTPICLEGQVIGFLNLHSPLAGFFTSTHAERLQAFANQAAGAIQNARSFERAQALAALEERQRLARDLHDAVSQTLWSANITAEVLPDLWELDIEEGRKSLTDLQNFTRGALSEMRALLIELRPSGLVETRLATLLNQLTESMSNRMGVVVQLKVDGNCLLPAETQIAFYRVAQEALNNISRHTTATWAEVYLEHQPTYAKLSICDNGNGFDAQNIPSGRLGLKIMRERASSIGANLDITSQQGKGTQISMHWNNEIGVN